MDRLVVAIFYPSSFTKFPDSGQILINFIILSKYCRKLDFITRNRLPTFLFFILFAFIENNKYRTLIGVFYFSQ